MLTREHGRLKDRFEKLVYFSVGGTGSRMKLGFRCFIQLNYFFGCCFTCVCNPRVCNPRVTELTRFSISSASYQSAGSENGEGGALQLARVKLAELLPEDGAASGVYTRALEKLSLSLARNNAAVIELNGEDAALLRCALDSAKLYFRSRPSTSSWNTLDWVKHSGYLAAPTKEMFFYRAGRY